MWKNSHIHLVLETEFIESLRNQAKNEGISVSELCRRKLRNQTQLSRIESLLKETLQKINAQLNYKQEVNMVKELPKFKGYTVDQKLKQFRRTDRVKLINDFVDFDSEEGQELLAEYEESIE